MEPRKRSTESAQVPPRLTRRRPVRNTIDRRSGAYLAKNIGDSFCRVGYTTIVKASGRAPLSPVSLNNDAMSASANWLISACAESIASSLWHQAAYRAHPRVRGEHTSIFASGSTGTGSSPRARGAYTSVGDALQAVGLIPASAGSIRSRRRRRSIGWAHPRERGEHVLNRNIIRDHCGSSPRARGA